MRDYQLDEYTCQQKPYRMVKMWWNTQSPGREELLPPKDRSTSGMSEKTSSQTKTRRHSSPPAQLWKKRIPHQKQMSTIIMKPHRSIKPKSGASTSKRGRTRSYQQRQQTTTGINREGEEIKAIKTTRETCTERRECFHLLIRTLSVSRLSSPTNWDRTAEQCPATSRLQETDHSTKHVYRWKMKTWKNMYHKMETKNEQEQLFSERKILAIVQTCDMKKLAI